MKPDGNMSTAREPSRSKSYSYWPGSMKRHPTATEFSRLWRVDLLIKEFTDA